MLAKRIIPTLLCRGRQLVKGQRFDSWRSVGVAEQAVRIHQARGVDELVLLDITATAENRGPDLELVEKLAESCFMPLTVGGGVKTVEDVRALLEVGADKVVVGTAAQQLVATRDAQEWRIRLMADAVGSQAIVAALDVPKEDTPQKAAITAHLLAQHGAGEILLTRMDREGTMEGYDLDLIRAVSSAVDIPVIAHGGCGTYQHMVEAVRAGASAVATGAMLQFTDQTPKDAARYLQQHGIEARIQ